MEYKEQVLANICSNLNESSLLPKSQGKFKEILRCCGLEKQYNQNSKLLEPYQYVSRGGQTYENLSPTYNLFLGLDNIFSDLYKQKDEEGIVSLLVEIAKHLNTGHIERLDPNLLTLNEKLYDIFQQLANLYNVFGLQLTIDYDNEKFEVKHFTGGIDKRLKDVLVVEEWLKKKSPIAHDAYISAIQSYQNSNPGATIESCRTVITSIFSLYKGADNAKWYRGVANSFNELDSPLTKEVLDEFGKVINSANEKDLGKFLGENYKGSFKKTRAIYAIYSMMSDYGTHRGEGTIEIPNLPDALMMLRITEDILIWIYSRECE